MWTKDKKIVESSVLVTNGRGAEYMVAVEEDVDEETKLRWLEQRVTKVIKELEEKDMVYVCREALMFGVFTSVTRSQAECFIDFLTKDKKYDLNMFLSHADKMTKTLAEYNTIFGEEQVKQITEALTSVVHDMFTAFKTASEDGRLPQLAEHIKQFYEPTKTVAKKKKKLKAAK